MKISLLSSEDFFWLIIAKQKSPETIAANTSVNCQLEDTAPD